MIINWRASKEREAPTTLLRLILARGPLSEKQIVGQVFKLRNILFHFSSDLDNYSILLCYWTNPQMKNAGLMAFITLMWIMILAAAAFLVMVVAPMEIVLLHNGANRTVVSTIQASISIIVVMMLILFLSKFKKIYVRRNLKI